MFFRRNCARFAALLACAAAAAAVGEEPSAVAPAEALAVSEPVPAPEADAARVVERARACLGSEEALSRVNALEYAGKIYDGQDALVATFRYVYQKPHRLFREEMRPDGVSVALVKDELEAWIIQRAADGKVRRVVMPLSQQDFERNLAADRLYFYRGIDAFENAAASLAGVVNWNGARAYRVDYAYPVGLGRMKFSRLFDVGTGRFLALLSNGDKTQSVETGERVVDGIRFPKTTRIYQNGALARRVEYDRIIVNGAYAPEVFRAPAR